MHTEHYWSLSVLYHISRLFETLFRSQWGRMWVMSFEFDHIHFWSDMIKKYINFVQNFYRISYFCQVIHLELRLLFFSIFVLLILHLILWSLIWVTLYFSGKNVGAQYPICLNYKHVHGLQSFVTNSKHKKIDAKLHGDISTLHAILSTGDIWKFNNGINFKAVTRKLFLQLWKFLLFSNVPILQNQKTQQMHSSDFLFFMLSSDCAII